MKTVNVLFQHDTNRPEASQYQVRTGSIIKYMLLIFVISMVTLMTSCVPFAPGHGPYNRGNSMERRGHDDNRGNREHRDHDDRGEHREKNH